jgi:hypothetical protein
MPGARCRCLATDAKYRGNVRVARAVRIHTGTLAGVDFMENHHMSKQERSTQSTDKQNLNREQKQQGDKQQQGAKQQGGQAQSGAKDSQPQQSVQDREQQKDTGHHQDGGFAGWEQDHKKDLKEDAKK